MDSARHKITSVAETFPGFTKVLVNHGDRSDVIDLEDPSQTCESLPPVGQFTQVPGFGGLTASFQPIICDSDCYIYDSGSWNLVESLNSGRASAKAGQSPFDGQLWISGGFRPGTKLHQPAITLGFGDRKSPKAKIGLGS